ncbi:cytochrome b [Glaciimonas immobilis]|uniref:Cytochrome b561 n=1 Tax=Glaciimonas immobilis TaxID=728004 RepID=A0A840RYE9_9BURK|nr:cytochrome b [Glaciimonas immobilis]KAF3998670.1 cytochrome b [Glaciimonas immobilis]MBB5201541.1 cytochrome b561 [Glaciimonas immobilis]
MSAQNIRGADTRNLTSGVSSVGKATKYRPPAIVMHWVVGLLIISLLVLGYYMINIPKGTPGRADYFNLHKSLGVMTGVLILLRLAWRFTHRVPPFPSSMPQWEVKSAQWSHRLLYLSMIVQPASGYLSSSFNKYGVKFFGIPLPKWGWEDPFLRDMFGLIHYVAGAIFAALVILHVLAALKHRLIDRDGVFQRMLP